MNKRYATKQDQEFIDELCQLSWKNHRQWIGYPRVEDLDVLMAEIEEYENTLEDSLLIIENGSEPIGFTGFLHEPGDDEAFIIGPVFIEEEHTLENVSNSLQCLVELSTFKDLFITVPSENTITNQALQSPTWKVTHEQYEMKYELDQLKESNLIHNILPLSKSKDSKFSQTALLFEEVFEWQNAEERLRNYLDEFGMEAAYIEKGAQLLGAVLWDDVEGTNFIRLEDVAVHPNARRQGVATELILHVLKLFVDTDKTTVFLAVDQDNSNAIKLYKRLGFETTMFNRSYKYMNESTVNS